MNRKVFLVASVGLTLGLAGCSLNFHIDFLGTDTLREVVLKESPAREKILMIDISGMIVSGGAGSPLEREADPTSMVYSQLERAAADREVRGVILRLDTPGGEVAASDVIHHEIRRFKDRTGLPISALMTSVAASGGYYLACACDTIIAHPATITGSIGVIALFPEAAVLLDKLGLRVNVIRSGELKDAGSFLREMTEAERELFQRMIDEDFQAFLEAVAAGRAGRLSMEEVRRLADGRVYTGRQALELKLVDRLGYFDTALEETLRRAGLRSAKVVTYTYYPKTRTNIYSAAPSVLAMLGRDDWRRSLAPLKSGLYYLWLPQLIQP